MKYVYEITTLKVYVLFHTFQRCNQMTDLHDRQKRYASEGHPIVTAPSFTKLMIISRMHEFLWFKKY